MTLPSGIQVAAVIAVNSYGSIFDYKTGNPILIPVNADDTYNPLDTTHFVESDRKQSQENTTIGIIATDAAITKPEANYIAGIAHDGLALTIRPCHTMRDGDTLFALGTGETSTEFDIDELGIAAVQVVADAVISAVSNS